MIKTLLVIGNRSDKDALRKLTREHRIFHQHNFDIKLTTYEALLRNKSPKFNSPSAVVFLFFPFSYWNRNIESKDYSGVYGNRTFYIKFERLWKLVDSALKGAYPDKRLCFINHPLKVGACRDKILLKRILRRARIPIPQLYKGESARTIRKRLERGQRLFIKVRYGSMGKGITYLQRGVWLTNFGYRERSILSLRSDHGWKFRDVTNKKSFLRHLLKEDVVIEEAVDLSVVKDRIFDLRIYVFFNRVLFIYPRSNSYEAITTNISQGARGEFPEFLKYVPKKTIESAKKYALKAAKVLDLNFAGVDVIINRNMRDVYVLEVNAFPGFPKRKIFNLGKVLAEKITSLNWK